MKLKFQKVADTYVAKMPTKIGVYEIQIFTNYDKKFGWQIYLDNTFWIAIMDTAKKIAY